jgi:hypothetical protein
LSLFKGIFMLEGASLAFPIRASVQAASGADQNIRDQVRSPDVDMVIGGGIPIGRIAVEGRYEGGFRNIFSATGAPAQRNRSFSFIVRTHF